MASSVSLDVKVVTVPIYPNMEGQIYDEPYQICVEMS